MKWNDVYILLLSDGQRPMEADAARLYKDRYYVPDDHCFSLQPIAGFTPISSGCLGGSTMESKIIILSHGNQWIICVGPRPLNYRDFALYMQNDLGLRRAGLLSFKCCRLGEGTFLEAFRSILGAMRIGYMIAYRYETMTRTFGDNVVHIATGPLDGMERIMSSGRKKRPDELRVKVVEGNHPTVSPVFSMRFWDVEW